MDSAVVVAVAVKDSMVGLTAQAGIHTITEIPVRTRQPVV
jgi:hypothetical protein